MTHDLQDWRQYKSQIDWSSMRVSAKMAASQSKVVDRSRHKGVELSRPVSDNSPGGWPQDFVTKKADGTPVYSAKLFDIDELIALTRKGFSQRAAADRLNVSRSTVKGALKKLRDAQKEGA